MIPNRIELDRPLTGRSRPPFVLVQDEVSAESPTASFILEPASSGWESIYIKEDRLDRLVKEFSRVPIYGIWQSILASKVIPPEATVAVLETSDKGGLYLQLRDGKAFASGSYRLRKLPPGVGEMEDAFMVHEHVSIDRLVVPKRRALHPSELARVRAEEQKRLLIAPAVGVAAGLALCLIADVGLSARAASIQKQIQAVQEQVKSVEAQASDELVRRNDIDELHIPNTLIALTRFAELIKSTIEPSMALSPVAEGSIKVEALSISRNLSFPNTIKSVPGRKMTIEFDAVTRFEGGGSQ